MMYKGHWHTWPEAKEHYVDHYDADCVLCRFVAVALLNDAQERADVGVYATERIDQ